MKKLLASTVTAFALLSSLAAEAKCYYFPNAPDDTKFCVGKNGSDSQDDRKLAKSMCDKAAGKDCGSVMSSSTQCHSNIGKCIDETGKASRDLNGY